MPAVHVEIQVELQASSSESTQVKQQRGWKGEDHIAQHHAAGRPGLRFTAHQGGCPRKILIFEFVILKNYTIV